MIAVEQARPPRVRVLGLAVALAVIAALAYVLINLNVLAVGDVQPAEDGGVIIYVAAGSYLIGGLLILTRRRWLWAVGAVMNALVILFFIQMYQNRPAVLFSPGGLATKAAQLLLEVSLIYLIIADGRHSHRQSG
jgi:hypothetical protein